MSKKPFIYIGGPGYSYEDFEPLIDQISDHFEEILKTLKITDSNGDEIKIKLFVEVATPETIRAFAVRKIMSPRTYEIRMTAGLSYHLWLASRALATDAKLISWTNKIKVIDQRYKGIGKKEVLADFAYFLSSYLILLHELSHVVLGHCDYVQDELGFESLDEFGQDEKKLSESEIRIRKAFEAEADRQAGEFLLAFLESTLGRQGLGQHIRFPSRKHVYEFYTYAITLVCVLLQQLTNRKGNIHPKPNERQYIILSGIQKYFNNYQPDQFNMIHNHVTLKMIEAAKCIGLIEGSDPKDLIKTALSLSFVDDVVKETKIKDYQLSVK